MAIARDADDAAWELAHVGLARRDERRVRTAETHRHAEALRAADGDVGAPRCGRREKNERERIARSDDKRALFVRLCREILVALDTAVGRRVLNERAAEFLGECAAWRELLGVSNDDLDAEPLRARFNNRDRLRVAIFRDEELRSRFAGDAVAHVHRLSGGGAFIEERRAREREAGQL